MVDLAQVDDLMLSLYLCQGTMPEHRHVDQDELFLVYSGSITLESEWGTVVLRPWEVAVVPKGVGHRSSSMLHSLVLLLEPRVMVHRRNGDRRLFALKDEGHLEKVSVSAVGMQVAVPFQPVTLADLDMFACSVMLCRGSGPWWKADNQSSLVLCHAGRLSVDSEVGQASLEEGELVVVPVGVGYRLSSPGGAIVLGVQRHKQPG